MSACPSTDWAALIPNSSLTCVPGACLIMCAVAGFPIATRASCRIQFVVAARDNGLLPCPITQVVPANPDLISP